jgi:hypothetical protein
MHETYEAPETIGRMMLTAQQLLYTMSPAQRGECAYPMDHPSRLDWDFIPKADRTGLPLWQLDRHQKVLVHSLLAAGLSMRGYTQALEIMAMENVLREIEIGTFGVYTGDFRNAENYFLTIFGKPSFEDTWAWRFLGHHLSLSYTIVGQQYLTVTPCNFGAQPAQMGTLSPLRADEDLAFGILGALSRRQRQAVIIHDRAPADYATRQVPRIGAVEYPDYIDLGIPAYRLTEEDREALKFEKRRPRGLPGSELPADVALTLTDLVESFLGRMPDEVSQQYLKRVKADGLDKLWFCWAGGEEMGTSHYFRIQGKDLLFEFDNAMDSGNHIHSVWRDYQADLGHQLLLDHYEHVRHHGHHLQTRLESSVPDDEDQPGHDEPAQTYTHNHTDEHPHEH